MKKIILSLAFLATIANVNAQDFSLNPKVSTVSVSNSEMVEISSFIKNNTLTTDTVFNWVISEINLPGQWELSAICDPKDCYPGVGLSVGFNKNFILKKDAQSSFKFDIDPKGYGGDGTVKVIVKSTTNASNTDTITVAINAWITGVNEVNHAADIKFYPNPVKDLLNFKYASATPVSVDIYNILGVKVKSFVHDGTTTQVNVSDLQNGVYFIRFKGTTGSVYSKSFTKSE